MTLLKKIEMEINHI